VSLLLWCAVIFVTAYFVYSANGDTYIYTYDSAPNSLLVFNVLERHRLDFDDFRGSYFDSFGAGYIWSPARDGRLSSTFPIGTALLTAPIYAGFDLKQRMSHKPFDITSIEFERTRLHYEKRAATIVAALAAVLLFLCARQLAPTPQALIVTAFFAFGTEMWVIGSQALWQHGSINLVTLCMLYAFFRINDSASEARHMRWLWFAGLCAGFVTVVRPTAIIFSVAAAIFVLVALRGRTWPFWIGAVLGAAPGIVWNWHFFHTLTGPYGGIAEGGYTLSLPAAAIGLTGLLLSPSKGLLIYTPLMLLSAFGAVQAARSATRNGLLLALFGAASLALIINYAFFSRWMGGSSYGDRYLTDVAGVGALLLLYVWPKRIASVAAFSLLFAYCVAVQFVGANGEVAGRWSEVPYKLDAHPERIWALHDTQIERDALATLHKFIPK